MTLSAMFAEDAERAVMALADQTALIDGAYELPVIFQRQYVNPLGQVQMNQSAARFAVAAYPTPGPRIGDVLVIGGRDFVIAAWAEGSDEYTMTAILNRVSEEQ